jgi:hypothetical protein
MLNVAERDEQDTVQQLWRERGTKAFVLALTTLSPMNSLRRASTLNRFCQGRRQPSYGTLPENRSTSFRRGS